MLLLIAFFVWSGAHHEASLARVKSVLRGLTVRSAMITAFRTIGPDEALEAVARLTVGGLQHDFPVVDRGQLAGILTRADLMRGLAERPWHSSPRSHARRLRDRRGDRDA
jgi:CBS-domain-containing membrane protein